MLIQLLKQRKRNIKCLSPNLIWTFFKKEVFMAPKTVAIIMDGNGRWAKRGLPRTAGHKKGADTIRTVALAAQDIGIQN